MANLDIVRFIFPPSVVVPSVKCGKPSKYTITFKHLMHEIQLDFGPISIRNWKGTIRGRILKERIICISQFIEARVACRYLARIKTEVSQFMMAMR
jgi:hypothetical protein